ncbi:MAG: HDOD domain-containing protein [Phycisphaeraceae bacterium]|nr:HDOD domain-containing protein [Phycisphaeraceae bacterium]
MPRSLPDILQALDDVAIPGPAGIASRIGTLLRRTSTKPAMLAELLRCDPWAAAQILRERFQQGGVRGDRIFDLRRSILLIGQDRISAVAASLRPSDPRDPVYGPCARRALACAIAARLLAETTGAVDPDEAWFGGLLQDLAVPLLADRLGTEYTALLGTGADHGMLVHAERAHFGFDHADIAAGMLRQWHFPDDFADAIGRHHHVTDPGGADPHGFPASAQASADASPAGDAIAALARILNLASLAAATVIRGECRGAASRFALAAGRVIAMGPTDAHRLLHRFETTFDALEPLLRDATGELRSDARIERTRDPRHEAGRERAVPDHASTAPAPEVATAAPTGAPTAPIASHGRIDVDPATGFLDALAWEPVLQAQVERAVAAGEDLALLAIEVDELGRLNAQAGFAAGDVAIAGIAGIITQTLLTRMPAAPDGAAIVARSGDDEFSILLPGTPAVRAADLAERLRIRVRSELPCTIRIGVVALVGGGPAQIAAPALFLRIARRAADAARAAGGDCVRMFRPRLAA